MFFFYKFLTTIFFPIFIIVILIRKMLKKEDPTRYKEKIFPNKIKFKKNNTVWFHAASIGEVKSIMPFVKYFIKHKDGYEVLITSVTLSSEKIVEKEFNKNSNVQHQYFPLDTPFLSKKFIESVKPKLAIFVDSEIWPNFIYEIKKKNIPLILLNARITKKTFKRWKKLDSFSKSLFSKFDKCIASSKDSENHLKGLGCKNVKFFGNIKFISHFKKEQINFLQNENLFKGRMVWLAASTHPGEEQFILDVHHIIKKVQPNILTIIIPRHIDRINKIYSLIDQKKINVQIINDHELIKPNVEVALINSFGELTKYYANCGSVLIGKSLSKDLKLVGGQNPLEAASFGCKIYHGPYVYNFQEIYNYLMINKISTQVNSSTELANNLLTDFSKNNIRDKTLIEKIDKYGKDIFEQTVKEINMSI